MAFVHYKGLLIIAEGDVAAVMDGDKELYVRQFQSEVVGMSQHEREDFLLRKAVVKADEYLAGGIGNDQFLETWE